MRGQVIRVRGLLKHAGWLERLRVETLDAIRSLAGDAVSDAVAAEGFEFVHRHLTVDQIVELREQVGRIAEHLAPQALPDLVGQVLGHRRPFHFETLPNVRFHIPHGAWGEGASRGEFQGAAGGKLTPHPPHQDSYFRCPMNGINLWCAVGSVAMGNGLSLYPSAYGRPLAYGPNGRLAVREHLGPALNFTLTPGDAVVFHGEHVHASEVNWTDRTRYVVSFRITERLPAFPRRSGYRYRRTRRAFGIIPHRVLWWIAESAPLLRVGGKDHPDYLTTRRSPERPSAPEPRVLRSSDVAPDRIVPAGPTACVTRLASGRVVAFGRYCPHEGADLARGYLRDGRVMCPWHNLPIDPETGQSPCASIKCLATFDCREASGRIEVGARHRGR